MNGDTTQSVENKGGKLPPGKEKSARVPKWARVDRPRDFRTAVTRLFSHAGKYRYAVYAGVILSVIGAVLSVIGPKYLERIADEISDGITSGYVDMGSIGSLALVIVVLYACSVLFSTAEHILVPSASQRIANMLRGEMAQKINRLPLNYYDNSSAGDIMSRVTNDADTVGESCGISLNILFTASAVLIGCTAMMFLTSPVLAAAAVTPTAVGFVLTRVIISRSHKYYVAQSRDMGAMNGLVEEIYYGHDIVRAYNGEERARERFSDINDGLARSVYKSRFVSSTLPQIMNFIGNLGYVTVCIVGSMMVINGDITYGVIVAFIVYVKMFSSPLLQLSDAFASMQSLAASSERIFDLLDAPEMSEDPEEDVRPENIRGEVEFRDVTFSYVEGSEIIHRFSLSVAAGEKIAIVGPTGAGKTTIVNLLMRFYEVDSGDILIDGVSTKSMSRSTVHGMFSMVVQDAWLFEGTIRENIAFNSGIGDREIFEACESVGIHDYIIGLPNGYDTVMTSSAGLSAGQKQQIAIARAMVRSAPMVIFDEATSSVDTRTEKKIQNAVDFLTAGKTSFIIAHRLTTIMDCDRIMVMKEGRIVEIGTHGELLEKGGFYAELYDSQFENCA